MAPTDPWLWKSLDVPWNVELCLRWVLAAPESHLTPAGHCTSLPCPADGKERVGTLHSTGLLHSLQAAMGWDWFARGVFKFEEFLGCLGLEILL